MRISDADLLTQYRRAVAEWPWVAAVERPIGLPPMLLWAVASRETNMTNIIGDGGHGIGIWQRDRRAWDLPGSVEWYIAHPRRQAEDAAAMLLGAHSTFGTWHAAIAAYNAGAGAVRKALTAGVDPDSRTTQGDYASDVESRRVRLLAMTGHPAAPTATTTRSAMPAVMLSQHFARAEFACRHCGALPRGGVSLALLRALELARTRHYPGGLPIASGYRCPAHRLSQATPSSRHTKGDAADIPPVMTVQQANACGFKGIGFNRAGLVVHVDMRPTLLGRVVTFPDAGTA